MNKREDCLIRMNRIPEPIRRIGDNNPHIHNLCTKYAIGDICTLDEMLCQMVVQLSRGYNDYEKRLIDLMQNSTFPPTINRD